jgi:hypothetical protein
MHRPLRPRSVARAVAAADGAYLICRACDHVHEAEDLQHALYIASRSAGDIVAAQRGRLGRRLVRRAVTRAVMRSLWR